MHSEAKFVGIQLDLLTLLLTSVILDAQNGWLFNKFSVEFSDWVLTICQPLSQHFIGTNPCSPQNGPWERHFCFAIAISQTRKPNQKEVRHLPRIHRHGVAEPGPRSLGPTDSTMLPVCEWVMWWWRDHPVIGFRCPVLSSFRPGDFDQRFMSNRLRGCRRRLRVPNCSWGKQGWRLNRGGKKWRVREKRWE